MTDNENRTWLYKKLKGAGYNLGEYDEFSNALSDDNNKRWLYDKAQAAHLNVGTFDDFSKAMMGTPAPTSAPAPTQTQVAEVAPSPAFKPTAVEPKVPEIPQVQPTTPVAAPRDPAEQPARPANYVEKAQPEMIEENVVEGFAPAFKQSVKGTGQRLKYLSGEVSNLVAGSSDQYRKAGNLLDKVRSLGYTDDEISWILTSNPETLSYRLRDIDRQREQRGDTPIDFEEKNNLFPMSASAEDRQATISNLRNAWNQAGEASATTPGIKQSDAAKAVIGATEVLKKTWGDRIKEKAAEEINKEKPTKGFAAWAGAMVPQAVQTLIGIGLTAATRNPLPAKILGFANMAELTGSEMGGALKEARDYGASDADAWASSLLTGAVEYGTELIPFSRYFKRVSGGAKGKIIKDVIDNVQIPESAANEEMTRLLKEGSKKLGGKFLTSKTAKDIALDLTAESASEFTAEALETMIPMIYQDPEDYPTLSAILKNGWEGAKGGLFLGALMGVPSTVVGHHQMNQRRKEQGFVDLGLVKKDGEDVSKWTVNEIVGKNDETGSLYVMTEDGSVEEIKPEDIAETHRYSYDEFREGVLQKELDNAYDNGQSLETPQEMHDAELMRESRANDIRELFGLAEDEDIDAFLNGNPGVAQNDEEQQMVDDYMKAKANEDGMIDKQRSLLDEEVNAVSEELNSRTNPDDGMIHPVVIKGSQNPHHVVSGAVVTFEDGTVDENSSSSEIIVVDDTTGEKTMMSPQMIESVGEVVDPTQELEVAKQDIYETKGKQMADAIDGVLPMNPGDQYTVLSNDGNLMTAIVGVNEMGLVGNGDGTINVSFDGGQTFAPVAAQELQAMSDAYNQARVDAFKAQQTIQQQEEAQEEAQPADAAAQTEEPGQVAEPMPMIGEGEEAEPDFMNATPERAHQYIYEEAGLTREEAADFVKANIAEADKNLTKAKKNPPKIGTNIAKYKSEKAQYESLVGQMQGVVDYWNAIKAQQDAIVAAETQQAIAEQEARQAEATEKAIIEEQARVAEVARKQEELEQLGANNVSPIVSEKWNAAQKIEGAPNELTLANGEKIQGKYYLVESGAASASHDANNGFVKTEGFPVDENGQSVNDRDYEHDADAQEITRRIASEYDNRAVQTPVIVSRDGVVLSGNGRTMAGELAAANNTDGAYIEYLTNYPQQFGFTPEQVSSMQHPRVVFVPDVDMPYNAETFAKFNQQEMKGQSKTETAVKLGKVVDDDTFKKIIRSINRFDRLADFYADNNATRAAIKLLNDAGVLSDVQMSEMFDADTISAHGKELLENMLIGKAFESNPNAVRQITTYKSVRQSIISALAEISNNIALGEEYSLENELSEAVDLVYKARQNGIKEGEAASSFARQGNLFQFDDGATAADYNNATVMMLADVLNDSRATYLRKILTLYNDNAADGAAGQQDLFTGSVETKDQILTSVQNIINYGTEAEQQAAIDNAVEQRKAEAESIQEDEPIGTGDAGQQQREADALAGSQPDVAPFTALSPKEGEDVLEYAERIVEAEKRREEEAKTDTNPTEAQKEAGNYKKGHIKIDGYDITIENPKGSERSGVDENGNPWSITMNNTYGYIRRTEGVDGDHIDVFLSDDPDSGSVFVVDQVKPDGSFDEHKVMYGFNTADEAREAYLSNYSEGWQGLGTITEVSKEEFKKWIESSHRKTKPFAEYKSVKAEGGQNDGRQFKPGLVMNDYAEQVKEAPLIDKLAKALGIQVHFVDEVAGGAANASIEGQVMLIEKNNPNPIRFLIGHEITHRVQDLSPEAYAEYKQAAKEAMTDFDARMEKLRKAYERAGINISDSALEDEVVADFAGDLAFEEDTLDKFVSQANPTIIERIKDLFEDIVSLFSGNNKKAVHNAIEKFNAALSDATSKNEQTMDESSKDDNDIRYSLKKNGVALQEVPGAKDKKSLVGMHNITEGKLKKALKLGGLANPSAAVINVDKQTHEGYGDISLVMPSSLVDKKTGRNAGTYSGDAWTPTYPSVERFFEGDGFEESRKDIAKVPEEMQALTRRGVDDFQNSRNGDYLAYMFLHERGVAPELEQRESIYPKDIKQSVSDIMNKADGRFRNLGQEEWDALTDLYIKFKYKGFKQLYDEAMRDTADRLRKLTEGRNPESPMTHGLLRQLKQIEETGKSNDVAKTFAQDVMAQQDGVDDMATNQKAQEYIKEHNLQDGFDSWLDELDSRYNVKERILTGMTESGDRKYVPHTLENASRVMNREGKQNAYDNTGLSATRSTLLKKMNTLQQIRKNKELLDEASKVDGVTEEMDERYTSIITKLAHMQKISDNEFMNMDYAALRLQEAISTSDIVGHLNDEYGYNISEDSDFAKELNDFIQDVKNMPSKYFETKFERPVYLNEFAAAVVPDNTTPGTIDALHNAGLEVFTYKNGDSESRQQAVQQASNIDGVRFSIKDNQIKPDVDEVTPSQLKKTAIDFGKQLGVSVRVVENMEDIVDDNKETQRMMRNAYGWFNPVNGEVVIVLPNASSIEEVRTTVLHEIVGHKGLQAIFGDQFTTFLSKVYNGASVETKAHINAMMERRGLSKRVATEEYIAELAEKGFNDRESRNMWQKIKDFFMDMLRAAKLDIGFEVNDNDLRYMLWRTYQMQRNKGVMGEAENIAMQQELGVGNYGNDASYSIKSSADEEQIELSDAGVRYSIRTEPAPKKTGVGYKVFVLKNGKLYPPMVANPNGADTPVGVWLNADAAPIVAQSKTGRSKVKAGGKGTQGGSGTLAYRPGWHLGVIPYAIQFNKKNPETGERELFPGNFVWAEVEYANDVDYQDEAMSYGYVDGGKFRHSYAGLPRVPENGSYMYRTNPNPETDPWVITGAMKVDRILTPSEVDQMVKEAGREPQLRQEGAITDEDINKLNESIKREHTNEFSKENDDIRYSLKVVDRFDPADVKGISWANTNGPVIKVLTNDGKTTTIPVSGKDFNSIIRMTKDGASKEQQIETINGFVDAMNVRTQDQINEREKLEKRAENIDITYDNFFINTKGVFTETDTPNRKPDYVSLKSDGSGVSSRYWYGKDNGGRYVIRQSDHWSDVVSENASAARKMAATSNTSTAISTCRWALQVPDAKTMKRGELVTGKIYLDDLNVFDKTNEALLDRMEGEVRYSIKDEAADTEELKPMPNESLMDFADRISESQSELRRSDSQKRLAKLREVNRKLKELFNEFKDEPISRKNKTWSGFNASRNIRSATKAQQEYDLATVKQLSDLVNTMIENELLDDMTRGEVKRLMSAVKNGTSRKDIMPSINKIFDIVASNQIRLSRGILKKLTTVKASKVNASGVEVRGKLDPAGQKTVKTFKEAMNLSLEEVVERMNDLQDKLADPNNIVANNAAIEYNALKLAKMYIETFKDSEAKERYLRNKMNEVVEQYKENDKADEEERKAYLQHIKTIYDVIRYNKMTRVDDYHALIDKLAELESGSMEKAKELKQKDIARIQEIHHNANSDMEGVPTDEHIKETSWMKNWRQNVVLRFLLEPMASWDQMLRYFGRKDVHGEGYLFNRFFRNGVMKAVDNEYLGMKAALKRLDEKAAEVYGKKGMLWSDLYSEERKKSNIQVDVINGGNKQTMTLTQGNALYIYMVNKMDDGKMKLRNMGITEEQVDRIANELDPKFIALADWVQEELLPDLRNKYNEVYERMFGAPMGEIENYFPLKILSNARVQEEDVSKPDNSDSMPSTITGSIIKRKLNSAALDLLNTDAFSLVIEHIQQMEHWAAFAEYNRDVNTLLSYKHFRNQVQNMKSVEFGSGAELWKQFKKTAQLASETYTPKPAKFDRLAANLMKGIAGSKIAFRAYTAAKQVLSYPTFATDANFAALLKNSTRPDLAWKWCMENLPQFEKRWKSRQAGDTRLMQTDQDWDFWKNETIKKIQELGMTPNAFVDAVVVAMGAKSVYDTSYPKYIEMGFSEEEADKRAKEDAVISFNETQQSNEGAYVSPMQQDRNLISGAFSLYRNSSMLFQRRYFAALRGLSKKFRSDYKEESIEFMTKQYTRQGLPEQQARKAAERRYSRSWFKDAADIAMFGFLAQFIWNLGAGAAYILLGDDDDEKKKFVLDAARHATLGGLEGLAGGNYLSEGIDAALRGEFKNFNPSLHPGLSDLELIKNHLVSDQVQALNDIINITISAYSGVNPKTVTDAALAIWDICDNDVKTAKEASMFIMRILNAPQSQLDKIYIDELKMTAKEARKYTPEELAERYVDYKAKRESALTGWAYTEGEEAEAKKKYRNRFKDQAKERLMIAGDKAINKQYDEYMEKYYKPIAEKVAQAKALANGDEYKEDDLLYEIEQEDPDAYYIYQILADSKKELDKLATDWFKSITTQDMDFYELDVADEKMYAVKDVQSILESNK